MVEVGEGVAVIPSFGLPACRNRRVLMSRLINPVATLEFHQIRNRGRQLPSGTEDFILFLRAASLDGRGDLASFSREGRLHCQIYSLRDDCGHSSRLRGGVPDHERPIIGSGSELAFIRSTPSRLVSLRLASGLPSKSPEICVILYGEFPKRLSLGKSPSSADTHATYFVTFP